MKRAAGSGVPQLACRDGRAPAEARLPRCSTSGAWLIVRLNWSWYAGALVATVAGVAVGVNASAPWSWLAVTCVALADGWLLLSLLVSHVIYDRSSVACGGWLDGVDETRIAVVHLGQDEASRHVAARLPHAQCQVIDIYDPERSGSPSLRRARASLPTGTRSDSLDHLPLADGAVDLVLVIFAAHEIRDTGTRVACFRELARIIPESGQIVVVEHVRDGWNLLAYGPGAFHFLAHRTWLHTFAQAGLRVAHESTLTPWVRRFELRKIR